MLEAIWTTAVLAFSVGVVGSWFFDWLVIIRPLRETLAVYSDRLTSAEAFEEKCQDQQAKMRATIDNTVAQRDSLKRLIEELVKERDELSNLYHRRNQPRQNNGKFHGVARNV